MEQAEQAIKEKILLLDKIYDQNSTLLRFIKQRKMVGIRRVLRERGEVIEKLLFIDGELKQKKVSELMPAMQAIDEKYRKIIESSRQVLREANYECACIAAELRNSRNQRQVRNQYLNPWNEVIARGRRINTKG